MKAVRFTLKAIGLLLSSVAMFCMFMVGPPPEKNLALLYIILAIGASISIPMLVYTGLLDMVYRFKKEEHCR